MEDLKTLVLNDLKEHNETERLKRIEANSKLKEIEFYTLMGKGKEDPRTNSYKTLFDQEGIKYVEKDIMNSMDIFDIVKMNQLPIIHIPHNDVWLVQGRELQNAKQSIQLLQHYAHENYKKVPFEVNTEHSIKNIQKRLNDIGKSLSGLTRQLTPVLQLLKEATKEEIDEKKNK